MGWDKNVKKKPKKKKKIEAFFVICSFYNQSISVAIKAYNHKPLIIICQLSPDQH